MFFFFNDTATTEIYTLSLHDALPISGGTGAPSVTTSGRCYRVPELRRIVAALQADSSLLVVSGPGLGKTALAGRSEEHTSELQSRQYLVCRLLLEKKKQ